jgi:PAS domain S-box-containing protein
VHFSSAATLTFACALVAPAVASAVPLPDPEYLIEAWETEQGLPEDSATAMVQTPDGYLWFGTFNGLVRFDGVGFTVFDRSNTPELPSPGIVNLHLDRSGRLWVSTLLGTAFVKDGVWKVFGEGSGWAGDYVRFFAESPKGEVYVTTFDGKVLAYRGDRFEQLPRPPADAKLGFIPHIDEAGRLWVVNPQFVGMFTDGEWQRTLPTAEVSGEGLSVAAGESRGGGLWIATRRRLRKYQDGRVVKEMQAPWPMLDFWSLHEDGEGTVWICSSSQGVYRAMANGQWRHFNTGAGLTYHGARFVSEDREGNHWIGTSGGGVLRFKRRRFATWGLAEGLPERVVKSVAVDQQGRIVIGTHGQGLARLEEGRITRVLRPGTNDVITPFVQSTLADGQGRLWVGSLSEGLHLLENGSHRVFFPPRIAGSPTGGTIYALFEDSRATIWIGLDKGAASYAEGAFRTYELREPSAVNSIRCFAENRKDGTVWAGAQRGGLFRLEGERFVPVPEASDLVRERIASLLADEDGTLWIGTEDGGIARLRNSRLTRISEKEGLPARSIAAILADDLGDLWFGTNRGIVRASRASLEAAFSGARRPLDAQWFNLSDGLASVECSMGFQPAAVKDQAGRLWFATLKGVAVVDPAHLQLNGLPPRVVIDQVLIDGRRVAGTPPFATSAPAAPISAVVPAGAKRLEIHYAGLSFTAPEKVRYRHLVHGLDRDWVDMGDRRVAYLQDLKPGPYRFEVIAANNDGVWSPTATAVDLELEPHFYETRWFQGLCLLGAVLGGAGLHRRRTHRLRGHARELSRMVEARTHDLTAQIAERTRAEQELQGYKGRLEEQVAERTALLDQAEQKYRGIFENSVEGIFQSTPAGRYLTVNPALARLLGYASPEEMIADTTDIARERYAEPEQRLEFQRLLQQEGSVQGFVAQLRRRDGAPVWVSISARAVRDEKGALLFYEGTTEDITERKRADELSEALRRTERMSAMGMLVGGVAHEVRNPLFGISANLDALEANLGDGGEYSLIIGRMRSEVDRLAGLMQGLLDYGKPLESALVPEPLGPVILEAAASCETLAARAGVKVVSGVFGGLPAVSMVRQRLLQVFQNLFQNAIQHSPPGGAVSVTAGQTVGRMGALLVVTVSDSGPGFTPEDLDRVFEPFFSRRRGGTGLGLAIVQKIVEEHGGTITARNRAEGGAAVIVRLPVVSSAVARPAVASSGNRLDGSSS